MIKNAVLTTLLLMSCLANTAIAEENQVIHVKTLTSAPSMDELLSGWDNVTFTEIPLTYTTDKSNTLAVNIKAGVFEDDIYFYSKWADDTHDIIHKPYIWNTEKGKYITGPQREDRFALQFEISGNYTSNWFSGNEFVADMWHWKSSRTNPLGIAHDKYTILTKKPTVGTYKYTLDDGSYLYLTRKSDNGKPYKTKRYFKKQKDQMPKYTPLTDMPKGMDDIKAKGIWKEGEWHLLQKRKLNTADKNDVTFSLGQHIKGGIAVFNHDENSHHFISKTLTFALPPSTR